MTEGAGTQKRIACAISENPTTKDKMFNWNKKNISRISDDVINADSVEICREEDGGCGYAKKSCVCTVQKKPDNGPTATGETSIGRGFGQTYNLDED